jgi:hypothetical protein
MQSSELVEGQWYRYTTGKSTYKQYYTGRLVEKNVSSRNGYHRFERPNMMTGEMCQETYSVHSRSIQSQAEDPRPEPGTEQWAKQRAERVDKIARRNTEETRATVIEKTKFYLEILGMKFPSYGSRLTLTILPENIERLQKALELVTEDTELLQEVFDTQDIAMLNYEQALAEVLAQTQE